MPFHVMIWPSSSAQQKLGELYALNIDEQELREKIVEPYEQGRALTYAGRTLPAGDFGRITITRTEAPQQLVRHEEYETVKSGIEVTNEWIKGPPGEAAAAVIEADGEQRDPKRVMVVHGRNLATRNAIFTFLRALGLEPIEWEVAVAETGMGSPHNLEAVRAAMDLGQAVVVVLTAEDQAGLLPELAGKEEDVSLAGQPRQNVILEAGLAMGLNPQRTILVELGPIRRASDFEGLNTIRLSNAAATRSSLRSRLRNAGCAVAEDGTDWLHPETGGDLDSYARVDPHQPAAGSGGGSRGERPSSSADADLEFEEQLEVVHWEFDDMQWGGRSHKATTHAVAWVWVKNHGPTASFAAEVRETTGLPSDWGDYFIAEAAWDGKSSAKVEIPHGGRRKLKLAAITSQPTRGFWFFTSEGQNEVPGWYLTLGDDERAEIRFTLVLTNTSTDASAQTRGRVKIPLELAEASFELDGTRS